jgi:hypothetical protein
VGRLPARRTRLLTGYGPDLLGIEPRFNHAYRALSGDVKTRPLASGHASDVTGANDPEGSRRRSTARSWPTSHNPRVTIAELLEHLPAALVAVRRELRLAGRS